jgi:diguanylate cyclase (GGDEF)-like protein/PAS domain S-box-containing protein
MSIGQPAISEVPYQTDNDPGRLSRDLSTPFMSVVIAAGAVCFCWSIINLPFYYFDITFAAIAVCTLGFGSRVTVRIPRFNSRISASDTLIFLTLFLYGGEAAVVLAAVDAFLSARRFCRRKLTVWFNAGIMSVATTSVVLLLKAFGLYTASQAHGPVTRWSDFLIALCLIAVVQFLINTLIASVYDSMYSRLPWWETWVSKYIWVFMTYLAGALGAGALVKLAEVFGSAVLLAAFPIILFVLLSYKMYLRNVELSIEQAETARGYAAVLEERSNALRESETRFRNAFDFAPIGMALVSHEGRWLKVNHALSDILGYKSEEFLSSDFQSMIIADDLTLTLSNLQALQAGFVPNCQLEHRYRHSAGHMVWVSSSVSSGGGSEGDNANFIFQIQDITERKLAERELRHAATHDMLTGLPNRALFISRLTNALERSHSDTGHKASVLFIDLDHFKRVNDSHGHLVGDQLLKEISSRLKNCTRPGDMVARLGGDEFTILVEGEHKSEEVTAIAERIQESLSEPFLLAGTAIISSASIGVLHASKNYSTADEMMRDADRAMYSAKRGGKARHEVFNDPMLCLQTEQ